MFYEPPRDAERDQLAKVVGLLTGAMFGKLNAKFESGWSGWTALTLPENMDRAHGLMRWIDRGDWKQIVDVANYMAFAQSKLDDLLDQDRNNADTEAVNERLAMLLVDCVTIAAAIAKAFKHTLDVEPDDADTNARDDLTLAVADLVATLDFMDGDFSIMDAAAHDVRHHSRLEALQFQTLTDDDD